MLTETIPADRCALHSMPYATAALFCAFLLFVTPGVAEDSESMVEAELPHSELDTLRRQSERQGEFDLAQGSAVRVDREELVRPWQKVPFEQDPFTYTPAQMERDWAVLMRVYDARFPSPGYLRALYEKYPVLEPAAARVDLAAHARALLEVWRLFYRGDFQAARAAGDAAGFAGSFPGLLSQIMYAQYVETEVVRKHMLLQDVADRVASHAGALRAMKTDTQFRHEYALMRLLHVYALGRIAEDIPVADALRRGYAFKVLDGVSDFTGLLPEHPLSPALQSGVDANVVRKLGKAMGRITFGARQTRVREGFEASLAKIPGSAVIRYEYANALLFIDRKRGLDMALAELQRAAAQKPRSALEALDAMYAVKRRKELQALQAAGGSVRAFERQRMRWQKDSGRNLFCVTLPPFQFVK